MNHDALGAIVGGMTDAPWMTIDPPGGNGTFITDARYRDIADCDQPREDDEPAGAPYSLANACGIVALRNHATAWLALQEAVTAWRDAACETASAETDDYTVANANNECAGDTHAEACPVAVALRGVIAALAKIEDIR